MGLTIMYTCVSKINILDGEMGRGHQSDLVPKENIEWVGHDLH